jgi:N-succinyldiaminopimelate aminotransferase
VWNEIMALSRQPGVIDLGQGWPDVGASDAARRAAAAAVLDESDVKLNQYRRAKALQTRKQPPLTLRPSDCTSIIDGLPVLTHALIGYYNALHGWGLTPSDVLVTTSATEALYSIFQAFLDPGDEVLLFEPVFPWYVSHARLAGATPVCVRLCPPLWSMDSDALAKAFTPRTKLVCFNSPHNPSGHVATRQEVELLASLCVRHNVVVVADEVYERKVFKTNKEMRLRDAPGMAERTLTLGTSSKLLSLTGWRVGWVLAPPALLAGVRSMHSYSTFCAPTPLQVGVAAALNEAAQELRDLPEGAAPPADTSAVLFEQNARVLGDALRAAGLTVFPVDGGYFLVADAAPLTAGEYCKALIAHAQVAAVPMDVFYFEQVPPPPSALVRFAICKHPQTIQAAADAIRANPVPLLERT